jgi:hypothetical protein
VRGPINTRRYGTLLRSLWGLGGGATPGDEASDQAVQVSMDIEPDLRARPELAWPAGELLGFGRQNVAAGGAGFRSRVLLFNPPGSGMITVIEQILGVTAWQLLTTATTNPGSYTLANYSYARDQRMLVPWTTPFNQAGAAGCLVYTRNNAALAAGDDSVWESPVNLVWDLGVVMKPGYGWLIAAPVDNAAVNVSFAWRSRLALPQELNT